jgi:hypothetical protein
MQKMKFCAAICSLFLFCSFISAQNAVPSQPALVTVPMTVDHNRVVINVEIPLPDGSTQRVRAWVDNGNPDLYMSQRVANLMGLTVSCKGQICSGRANPQVAALNILIGGMKISFPATKDVTVPVGMSVIAPGMDAEINIPSTVLRHYDVLIDFPGHKFSIGAPGNIHFRGEAAKVQLDANSDLIQIPSKIENKKYNLGLDLGSSISFLSFELFDKLSTAHPDWPHMTGAVGPANLWGSAEETTWKVMRVDRVQYGPLFLANVAVVEFPTDPMKTDGMNKDRMNKDRLYKNRIDLFATAAGSPIGVVGSNALLNYRVGLDYTHSTVYFEFGRMFNFPEFDVIGLTLRPENDGRFTILGVVDFDGKPSVPLGPDGVQPGDHLIAVDGIPVQGSTLGQVWNMLGGTPGQQRILTAERQARQFQVAATVQHFLSELPDQEENRRKRK